MLCETTKEKYKRNYIEVVISSYGYIAKSQRSFNYNMRVIFSFSERIVTFMIQKKNRCMTGLRSKISRFLLKVIVEYYCVKSVHIRSFQGFVEFFYFVFSPNAEIYGPEKLRIRTLFTQCITQPTRQCFCNPLALTQLRVADR